MSSNTTWHFVCGHALVQVNENPNHGLAPTETAPGLCPSCHIQSLNVASIKDKDLAEIADLKEQHAELVAEIGKARATPGMEARKKIMDLECTLEDLLERFKFKILATADTKNESLSTHLRTQILERYEEVQYNITMFLDYETMNIRNMRKNAEFEECEHNKVDEGQWHYCDASERVMIPEHQLLIQHRTVLKEGLKEAKNGVEVWKRAWEAKEVEGVEGFEEAIEEWWGWVLKTLREKV